MYIKYKDIKYSCGCIVSRQSIVYTGLSENFSVPVEGEIVLCANDGFVMRKDNTTDYLRQTFSNGTLTLTNLPEPTEPEAPIEPIPSLEDRILTLETELEEAKAKNAELETQLTDTQLALCEVYEATLGG